MGKWVFVKLICFDLFCYFGLILNWCFGLQKSEIQRIIHMLENGEEDVKTVLYELHLVYTQGLLFVSHFFYSWILCFTLPRYFIQLLFDYVRIIWNREGWLCCFYGISWACWFSLLDHSRKHRRETHRIHHSFISSWYSICPFLFFVPQTICCMFACVICEGVLLHDKTIELKKSAIIHKLIQIILVWTMFFDLWLLFYSLSFFSFDLFWLLSEREWIDEN